MAQHEDETKPPKMAENWDPDRFPTSARPVFTSVGILIALIGALCFLVYYTSSHPTDDDKVKRKETVEQNLLADEQAEDGDAEEAEE